MEENNQKERQAYQELIAWYANSLRYRLGGTIIDSIKEPFGILKLPFRIGKLVLNRTCNYTTPLDIESEHKVISTPVSNMFNRKYWNDGSKKNILYILNFENGGTGKTNDDLLEYVETYQFNIFILYSNGKKCELFVYRNKCKILIKRWYLSSILYVDDFYNQEMHNIYKLVLNKLNIKIIHIQHLINHTLDIFILSHKEHIPIIMSAHDFYCICPTVNLINSKGGYCEGICTKSDKHCKTVGVNFRKKRNMQKWVHLIWRNKFENCLKYAEYIIVPSLFTKTIFQKIYPVLSNKLVVINHGRNFEYFRKALATVPEKGKKIRIVIAGNISYNKGKKYIMDLIKEDKNSLLEFHCIGYIPEELKNSCIYYGKYLRKDFKDYMERIRPSYVGIFSICPETYCHIMTEAWSCGIPCIVTNIGALKERAMNGGALIINIKNVKDSYRKIIDLSNNEAAYKKMCMNIQNDKFRSIEEMGKDYINLYYSQL